MPRKATCGCTLGWAHRQGSTGSRSAGPADESSSLRICRLILSRRSGKEVEVLRIQSPGSGLLADYVVARIRARFINCRIGGTLAVPSPQLIRPTNRSGFITLQLDRWMRTG